MKVEFVNPPIQAGINREGRCMVKKTAWGFILPPITLAYSAGVVRECGINVKIEDCVADEISLDILRHRIKAFQPDLIIINTVTPSILNDVRIIDIIKKDNPEIKIGLIGIHSSVLTNETFTLSRNIDYIIRGEPEFIIRDLVLALRDKRSVNNVKGLSYRKNNEIFHNPNRGFINDLDSLPFPAWDLINTKNYRLPLSGDQFLLISPSRGCPYQCIFCNDKIYYGEKIRIRSPQRVVDEIEWAINNFRIRNFHFWTESFTHQKQFALDILDEILRRNLNIKWTCNSRVDSVDLELLKKMKKAGCWQISYGVESGNQFILDQAKKHITLKQSQQAVLLAKKAGLEVSIQCIIGLLGETYQTALDTIRFAKNLHADYAQFYCAVPFPGSELFQMAEKNKQIIVRDWSRFEQSQSVLKLDSLTPKEIEELRHRAYQEYYLNYHQVLVILKKVIKFSTINNLIKIVKQFVKWIE